MAEQVTFTSDISWIKGSNLPVFIVASHRCLINLTPAASKSINERYIRTSK